MKGLCSKCEKRDTCQKLCNEAELWVSQDWVKQTENIIYTDNIDSYSGENMWEFTRDEFSEENYNYLITTYNFTDKQKEVLYMLFIDGKRQFEIVDILNISKQAVRDFLVKIGKKLRKGNKMNNEIM
jgi:DNA-directed RNA polymerase specialized sigma subunit